LRDKARIPRGEDSYILPARVANHSARFGSACPLRLFPAIGTLKSLIYKDYKNFILTVGCIAVDIYCKAHVGFKTFDYHARDLYGIGHPEGTCVLLEVSSLISLAQSL